MHRVFFLAVVLVGCDKSAEKVKALEERVDEQTAAAQEKNAEVTATSEKLEKRVAKLERRAATAEAEATAAAELQKADEARIDAMQVELDELKLRTAKVVEKTVTPEEAAEEDEEPPKAMAKVGVPECDEYLEKYAKCMKEKMPEAVRGSSLRALQTASEAWKKAAAHEASRKGLAQACKTALEAAGKAMKSMGCKF